jgi:hypothetical protein
MKHSWRQIAILGLLIIAFLIGVFVWPTRYRYLEMTFKGNVLPVRVDRFSGKTEVLFPQGWSETQRPPEESEQAQAVPQSEIAKVRIIRMRYSRGSVNGEIFNGTSYVLKEVHIRASARANGVLLFARSFRELLDLEPGSSASVSAYLDGLGDLDVIPLFVVESASGLRAASGMRLPNPSDIKVGSLGAELKRPTVIDLGRAVKAEYPGQYDQMSDWELGRAIKQQYPEQFGDFFDVELDSEASPKPR